MAVGTQRRAASLRRIATFAWIAIPIAIIACVAALEGPRFVRYLAYEPQEGDVIFQSLPRSRLVDAIEGATGSPWSHCGIVARNASGQWIVYEALNGVEATPLHTFVYRSRDQQYEVFRWKSEAATSVSAMLEHVKSQLGKPYDIRYRLDDEAIYCSELIYKAAIAAMGQPPAKTVALGELDWGRYRPLIEQIEGGDLPLDRQMITPRDLARSSLLERVHSGVAH